ncbi:MAG: C4-type zinc ribbon domain-containing protein [candidate division Zixibacteria bacterium]|nr:C4-type zinc ribbon domain-containing protein [candidate division Zixibacteria bacterium]
MNVNTTGGLVMNQELDLLLKLQVIDYDIGELERSKEYLPDMMDNLKKEISDSKNHFEQTNTDMENAKILQRQLELDISELENNLQKFQKQMMSIKTNKEYDALVAEIDNIKQKLSGKETELLETIDSIATFEKELEISKEKLSSVDENNLKQLEILQEKVDTIGNRMAGKINDRNEISASIPRRTLSVYERVRKGKGGAVVVAVKKRACGACYKALTPRKIQEVKKADKILTCDHCGRILFWRDEDSN